MFNKRILAIIKRELREKLMSKSFIFMTLLMPAIMFGFIGIQALLMSYEGGTTTIKLASESADLTGEFQKELAQNDFVKEGKYQFEFFTMDKGQFDAYLKSVKSQILDEKVSAVLFVSKNAIKDKKVEFYSKSVNPSITEKINRPINKVLVNNYFAGRLSSDEMQLASKGVDFTGFKVTEKEGIKEESYGNLILSYIFTILLYMGLLIMGQMAMQSVIEEKNNRIVEIILSSVSPKELLGGKIVGTAITALLQMAIWLSPILIVVSSSIFAIPKQFMPDVTMFHFIYLFFNFFCGLFIFIGLFAMVGSIFDNAQDAQSGVWPIMMLILIPFFISLSMLNNPSSPLAVIASMLPFASIIIMPARMTIMPVAMWQIGLTVIINIATVFAVIALAGKVYRIGILQTGTKPKWSEVIKWLKYKY
jgi:ABC-2 type transport system permease protein